MHTEPAQRQSQSCQAPLDLPAVCPPSSTLGTGGTESGHAHSTLLGFSVLCVVRCCLGENLCHETSLATWKVPSEHALQQWEHLQTLFSKLRWLVNMREVRRAHLALLPVVVVGLWLQERVQLHPAAALALHRSG